MKQKLLASYDFIVNLFTSPYQDYISLSIVGAILSEFRLDMKVSKTQIVGSCSFLPPPVAGRIEFGQCSDRTLIKAYARLLIRFYKLHRHLWDSH